MKPLTPLRLLTSNLRRRPFRTAALVLTVAVVTGGISVLCSLLKGMSESVQVGTQRFGADLVVIPRGGRAAAEGALIVGQPTELTLPGTTVEVIRRLPGVAAASPQVYVKTLTDARCCPGEFFLIGYDPATDFTLAPWLRSGGRRLGDFAAVVGSKVTLREGDQVRFFGTEFTVAGHLDETGVGIDSSVFLPLTGLREMVRRSPERAEEPLTIQADQISVVMVKAAAGVPGTAVAEAIANALDGIEVVLAPQVIGAAVRDLGGVLRLLLVVAGALWLVILPLLATAFSMAVAERRRDIGLHRALGATAGTVFRLVLAEALAISAAGAVLGLAASLVLTTNFGSYLAGQLGTPYLWPGVLWSAMLAAAVAGLALLTGAAAAILPARAAAATDPYECIRSGG